MLFKFKNCLHLADIIFHKETPFFLSCDHCLSIDFLCIVMSDHLKCAEYIHHDHFCIDVSLNFLESVCVKTEFKLSEALNEQLLKLLTKITKLCKTLKQFKTHIDVKVKCLAQELADDNDEMKNENNSLTMSQLVNSMSPSFFLFQALL